jgi:hypothetical protein
MSGGGSGGNLSSGGGVRGFNTGGIVPGPIGKPQLAMVHGGETILPTHKPGFEGMGGETKNFAPQVTIINPEPLSHSQLRQKEHQLLRNMALELGYM